MKKKYIHIVGQQQYKISLGTNLYCQMDHLRRTTQTFRPELKNLDSFFFLSQLMYRLGCHVLKQVSLSNLVAENFHFLKFMYLKRFWTSTVLVLVLTFASILIG